MASNAAQTLSGRYVSVPNPCTTLPCLPGLAHALQSDTQLYYLTVEGHWSATERSYGEYTPQLGAQIQVSGIVSEHLDARGKTFHTIEVGAMEPAR